MALRLVEGNLVLGQLRQGELPQDDVLLHLFLITIFHGLFVPGRAEVELALGEGHREVPSLTIAGLVLISVLLGGAETVLDLHLGFRSLAVSVEELSSLSAVLLLDTHIHNIISVSKLA